MSVVALGPNIRSVLLFTGIIFLLAVGAAKLQANTHYYFAIAISLHKMANALVLSVWTRQFAIQWHKQRGARQKMHNSSIELLANAGCQLAADGKVFFNQIGDGSLLLLCLVGYRFLASVIQLGEFLLWTLAFYSLQRCTLISIWN